MDNINENIFLYFYKDHISFQFSPADAAFCDELHDLEVHCKECSWSGKLQNFEVCLMNQLTPKIFQKKNKERKTCVLLGLIILKLFWITVYIAAYSVHTKRAIVTVYHSIIYLGRGGWYLCQQLIFHCSSDNNQSEISVKLRTGQPGHVTPFNQ